MPKPEVPVDRIDDVLVRQVLGLTASRPFSVAELGWTNSARPATLTFLDTDRYLPDLLRNPNIEVVIVAASLRAPVEASGRTVVESADPRYDYHALHNFLARARIEHWTTEIHPTAVVHRSAYVADSNVRIGAGTMVEPNATILEDVTLGEHCIVRAGAVIGSEGYEHKRTTRGIISVVHDGIVQIGDRVEVGANTCIDKGFRGKPTTIGNDTKIDNLVHIAHGVVLGERCMVVASAMLGGSTIVGDDAWVGPNATVSSVLQVGERAAISLGAVVTRDVERESRVSGNFAVAHDKLIAFLKSIR